MKCGASLQKSDVLDGNFLTARYPTNLRVRYGSNKAISQLPTALTRTVMGSNCDILAGAYAIERLT
ncbi:hypothetical protein PISMIDRAFT_555577 [Pisolithus microcarpus 441]|uniref:Uncharacterized protein n=1 Tax=Pisolithus microcarpus 441 TaxID=765257 RepID=A0A0C9ZRZ3_9AGAM|nr:hypothetical protein PISMIDRAFT_555577 [Pisolithus microcarpus 441]